MHAICVIKADGRRVPFDVYKVEATCRRAGASPFLAKRIAHDIAEIAYEGIRTREIYELVLAALAGETQHPEIKHRYRLKESIMLLGPAGFNFETYVAQVLAANGYEILSIRSKVKGRCVGHEIDLAIAKDGSKIMIECKYHNFAGTFTGLKESMYTHARFLDIAEGKTELFEKEMLVSNTRVSQDALEYALCVGQEVLSWRFPSAAGLERLIEQKGLYPITILKLSSTELKSFAKIGFMIARHLLEASASDISSRTGISAERISRLQSLTRRILL
ncbi:MAG TPA: ATP cone domain-containing protein [Nitrososphaera sp.]|nr:ATP cone domain-containing protein [Nitrososphaera sp.]